ncbi:MAG: transporter [Dehalococcoidia bacterium]|nr:transporter [Dehalococcoidia bacterium]
MTPYEKRVIGYTTSAHALVHIFELSLAAVLPMIALEYGVGKSVLGTLATAFALPFGSFALVSGVLTDRIGARGVMIICFITAAISAFLVGLSASVVMLAVTLALMGFATGLYHPAGSALISTGVRDTAKGFAYHGMAGNLGLTIAPLFAGTLAALAGWRSAYFALAVLGAGLAAVLQAVPLHTAEAPAPVRNEGASSVVYAASTLTGFIYRGALTFLPLYIGERVHISLFNIDSAVLTGSFASVAIFFGIWGQYTGGIMGGRFRLELLALGQATVLAPILLILGNAEGFPVVILASLFAFFHFLGQPVYNSLVAKYTPMSLRGRSYGLSFFCVFGLGSFSAGFSGLIAERMGTQWVFIILSGVAVLLAVLVSTLLRVKTPQRVAAP